MDRDDLVDHPRYRTGVERADPAVAAELDADHRRVGAHAAGRGRRSTPPRRCAAPITIVPGPLSRAGIRAVRSARDYWVDDDDPELGPLRLPGVPFKLASGAFAPFRPATRPSPTAEVAP